MTQLFNYFQQKNIRVGTKVFLLYFLLAFVSIIMSILIVFENQTDLISENTRMKMEGRVVNIINAMDRFSLNIGSDRMFLAGNRNEMVNQLMDLVRPLEKNFLLISENNEILTASSNQMTIPDDYKEKKIQAITNAEFSGSKYFLTIDTEKMLTYFYIPVPLQGLEKYTLLISYGLDELSKASHALYRQSFLVISIIVLINFLFALLHHRVIVKPLHLLHNVSSQIAQGDFNARADIHSGDEFADLARSVNNMAHSIKERFTKLAEQRDTVLRQKNDIETIANRDELTQLYNRRYLFACIESELIKAKKMQTSLGYIMIDIDYFKQFNDKYGHQIGDIVLKEVGRIIEKECRKEDIVARYGGEEFSILLPSCDHKTIYHVAERIRKGVESSRIDTTRGPLNVTISLGGTVMEDFLINLSVSDVESVHKFMNLLIYFADSALYVAKDSGRNCFEIG